MSKYVAISVTPGRVWQQNSDPVTPAKLNQTGNPTVRVDVETFEDSQTLTAAGAASIILRNTILSQTVGGPFTVTLASGTYVGQEKFFMCLSYATTATWNVTGAFGEGFTNLKFDTTPATTAYLKWNGVTWTIMGGNAIPS